MPNHLMLSNLYQYEDIACDPSWHVTEDSPQYHRMYYCYAGDVLYESAGHTLRLQHNTLYLFPILKPYRMTHDPGNRLQCVFFHLTLNHILRNDVIEFPIQSNTAESHLIQMIQHWMTAPTSESNMRHALNILLSIMEDQFALEYIHDKRILATMDYMKTHFDEKLTNIDLAHRLNIDHRYLIRLFKQCCGCTPQKYLSEYRLFQASQLLIQDHHVNEVAKLVGYEDAKAFSRFFKSNMHISPSEYKESYYLQP